MITNYYELLTIKKAIIIPYSFFNIREIFNLTKKLYLKNLCRVENLDRFRGYDENSTNLFILNQRLHIIKDNELSYIDVNNYEESIIKSLRYYLNIDFFYIRDIEELKFLLFSEIENSSDRGKYFCLKDYKINNKDDIFYSDSSRFFSKLIINNKGEDITHEFLKELSVEEVIFYYRKGWIFPNYKKED